MAFRLLEMVVDLVCGGEPEVSRALAQVAAQAAQAKAAADPLAHMRANIDRAQAEGALRWLESEMLRVGRLVSVRRALGLDTSDAQARLAALRQAAAVIPSGPLRLPSLPVGHPLSPLHGPPAPPPRPAGAPGGVGPTAPGAAGIPVPPPGATAAWQRYAGSVQAAVAQFGAVTGAGTGVVSALVGMATSAAPAAAGIAALTAEITVLGEAARTFATLHDEMTMFSAELTAMGKDAGAVVAGFEDLVRVGQRMGLTFSQARSVAMEAAQVTDGSRGAMENYMKVAVGLGRVMGGDAAAGQRLALAYGDQNRAMQPEQLSRYLRMYPRLKAEFIDAEKRGELVSVTIARMAQRGLDMQDVFRKDTFQASWDKMTGALERAWQSFSKIFGPDALDAVKSLADAVTVLANTFSSLTTNVDGTTSSFGTFLGYVLRVQKAILTLGLSEYMKAADYVKDYVSELFESESEKQARLAKGMGKIPAPGAEPTHGGFLSMEAMSDALANAAFGQKGVPEQQLEELQQQTKIQEEQLDRLRKMADKKTEGDVEGRPHDGDLPGV
jgi:hypothetical protein